MMKKKIQMLVAAVDGGGSGVKGGDDGVAEHTVAAVDGSGDVGMADTQ